MQYGETPRRHYYKPNSYATYLHRLYRRFVLWAMTNKTASGWFLHLSAIVAKQYLHQLAIWHIATKSLHPTWWSFAVAGGTGNVGRASRLAICCLATHG
jgi:hypothetical protein